MEQFRFVQKFKTSANKCRSYCIVWRRSCKLYYFAQKIIVCKLQTMPNENLNIFNDPNTHVNRAQWYNEIYQAYAWHFRIKERPATHEELTRFAQWQGLKLKEPGKKELVNFFLDQKISF